MGACEACGLPENPVYIAYLKLKRRQLTVTSRAVWAAQHAGAETCASADAAAEHLREA